VLLLISGSPENPGDLYTTFADESGEYSITGLYPARYMLWAWLPGEFGTYLGPADLAKEKQKGATVVVQDRHHANVDLSLLNPEESPK
jgi:hypothetical protein